MANEMSDESLSSLGISREQFISLFNDGTKIVANMDNAQILARINELKLTIATMKTHAMAAMKEIEDRKKNMSAADRAALRLEDAKYIPKQPPVENAPVSAEEKRILGLVKLGISREVAITMLQNK